MTPRWRKPLQGPKRSTKRRRKDVRAITLSCCLLGQMPKIRMIWMTKMMKKMKSPMIRYVSMNHLRSWKSQPSTMTNIPGGLKGGMRRSTLKRGGKSSKKSLNRSKVEIKQDQPTTKRWCAKPRCKCTETISGGTYTRNNAAGACLVKLTPINRQQEILSSKHTRPFRSLSGKASGVTSTSESKPPSSKRIRLKSREVLVLRKCSRLSRNQTLNTIKGTFWSTLLTGSSCTLTRRAR